MNKILKFSEYLFTVVSLLFYSGGPLVVVLSGGASEGDTSTGEFNSSLIQIIFSFIYLFTFLLIISRWKKVLYLLSKDKYIWVLVIFAVMSLLWSDAPAITIQRSFALVGTSLFGLYLATRYSLKQQLQMLSIMFGIAIVLSILFAIALPQYGIMGGSHTGAWRGIYTHKNGLGKMMIQSTMIFLLLAIDSKKKPWILWLGFSFSLILLLLSSSKGSLSNLAIILAILPIYRILRWRYDLMIPALTGIAIGYGSFLVWFMSNTDRLLKAIGKDPTLTGRTDLWSFVWEMIEKRPWLGYGYSGFWVGWDGSSAEVWRAVGWMPPNSHNGFLDLLLDLGVIGILIYLTGFVSSLLKSLTWVRIGRTFSSFWPLLYLTYLALANLTENTMLDRNSLSWVLYIAVALSVLEPPERPIKTSILENREILKDKYVY